MKEDVMDRKFSSRSDMRMQTKLQSEKLKGRKYLRSIDVDGRILKWI
jgi:hypothetical protein